jgi:hypothetical protein
MENRRRKKTREKEDKNSTAFYFVSIAALFK